MVTVSDADRAIRQERGNLTAASAVLGCARQTLYVLIEKHEELQQAVKDARCAMLDRAQTNLFAAVESGDIDVSKWVLARLDPEWREKQAMEHTGDLCIKWNLHELGND